MSSDSDEVIMRWSNREEAIVRWSDFERERSDSEITIGFYFYEK